MNHEPILRIRSLSKTYNRKKSEEAQVRALQDVSLEVFSGEFVAVVGVSGSGKSTLLHCIGSFEDPDPTSLDSIEYRHNEQFHNLRKDRSWYRQNFVGVIFQAFHLLPNLRVSQNVDVPLRLRKCEQFSLGVAERREAVHGVLRQLGIDKLFNKPISDIAGGECQRVAIARALVKRPRLLLADEPTGNLDVENTRKIVELLGELSRAGTAVLMVTHNALIAREYADRIITLSDGRVTSDERIERFSLGAAEGAVQAKPFGEEDHQPPTRSDERFVGRPRRDWSEGGNIALPQAGDREALHEADEQHEAARPGIESSISADRSAEERFEAASIDASAEPMDDEVVSDEDAQADLTEGQGDLGQSLREETQQTDAGPLEGESPPPAVVFGNKQVPDRTDFLPSEPRVGAPEQRERESVSGAQGKVYEAIQPEKARPRVARRFLAQLSNALRRIRLPGCDMGLWDLTGFALRDAKESSVSLFANVVAILFGTVLTALLLSLVFGAERYMRRKFTEIPQIESVSVWVDYSTGASPISQKEFEELQRWPQVIRAIPDIKQMAWLHKRPSRQTVAAFSSAAEDDPVTNRLELISGTANLDQDGWDIVIPERVAYELDNFDPLGLVGDTVTIELRRYAKGAGVENDSAPSKVLRYPVRVVGIVKSSPFDRVYASMNMVRFVRDYGTMRSEYVPEPGSKVDLSKISPRTMNEAARLHFSSPAQAEKAFQDMRAKISRRYEVHWPGEEYLYLRDVQLVAFLVFLGMGVLTITAGSISIFNTLQASVLRKTREIGILRALGLNRFSIFFVYMLQSVFVAILAALAGIGLSILTIRSVNPAIAEHWNLKDLENLLILPPWTMAGVVAVVICICAAAALIPAWRAAQKTPMDAIREAAS